MNARRGDLTRRRFIKESIAGAALVAGTPAIVSGRTPAGQGSGATLPWYRRAYRWGQTNITEKDPGPLRHRLVARLLEAHAGAGRHHQRRRHRRLLPEQVSAAPSRASSSATAISSAN